MALTFINAGLVFCMALDVLGEPLVELVMWVKHCGHDEVEKSPQLCHAVLYGGPAEQ